MHSVRDAAMVLRIREDEAKFIGRIVEGLTPTQRARFIFQTPTSTFLISEQMTLVDPNIVYADQTRTVRSTAMTINAFEFHPSSLNSRHSHTQSSTTSNPGKPVASFHCRKHGNIRKMCFLLSASLRKEQQQKQHATSKP